MSLNYFYAPWGSKKEHIVGSLLPRSFCCMECHPDAKDILFLWQLKKCGSLKFYCHIRLAPVLCERRRNLLATHLHHLWTLGRRRRVSLQSVCLQASCKLIAESGFLISDFALIIYTGGRTRHNGPAFACYLARACAPPLFLTCSELPRASSRDAFYGKQVARGDR